MAEARHSRRYRSQVALFDKLVVKSVKPLGRDLVLKKNLENNFRRMLPNCRAHSIGSISNNFGLMCVLADITAFAKFGDDSVRGFRLTKESISVFASGQTSRTSSLSRCT